MKRFPSTVPMTAEFLASSEGTALAVSYLVSNGWFHDISAWVHPRRPVKQMTTLEAVQTQNGLDLSQNEASEASELVAAGWILHEGSWTDQRGLAGIWPTRCAIEVEKHRQHKQCAENARISQLDRNGWIRRVLNAPGAQTLWRSPYTGDWIAFDVASEQEQKELQKRNAGKGPETDSVARKKPFESPIDQIGFLRQFGWFPHKDGYASPRDLLEDPIALSAKDAFLAEYSFQQELNLSYENEATKTLWERRWKQQTDTRKWLDPFGRAFGRAFEDSQSRILLHWWNADFIQQARDKGLSVRGQKSIARDLLADRLRAAGWVWLSVNGTRIPFWYNAASNRVVPAEEIETVL